MTGKNVYTMTAMTRRAFVGLAVMAAQAGLAGCVRNGAPDAGSSDGGAGKSGDAGTSSPFAPQQSAQASVDAGLAVEAYSPLGQGGDLKTEVVTRLAEAKGVTPGQIVEAMKILGFQSVKEVAIGADLCAIEEAEEFMACVPAKQPYMATSCCPAWSASSPRFRA